MWLCCLAARRGAQLGLVLAAPRHPALTPGGYGQPSTFRCSYGHPRTLRCHYGHPSTVRCHYWHCSMVTCRYRHPSTHRCRVQRCCAVGYGRTVHPTGYVPERLYINTTLGVPPFRSLRLPFAREAKRQGITSTITDSAQSAESGPVRQRGSSIPV